MYKQVAMPFPQRQRGNAKDSNIEGMIVEKLAVTE